MMNNNKEFVSDHHDQNDMSRLKIKIKLTKYSLLFSFYGPNDGNWCLPGDDDGVRGIRL